jgi:thiol-disulfide isomerase/thioredoxin
MGPVPTLPPDSVTRRARVLAAVLLASLSGCAGEGGSGRVVYHRVRYEGEPPPIAANPPEVANPPAVDPAVPADPLPAVASPPPPPEPAPVPPAPPAASLPPPAPAATPAGLPAPAPILPGAKAPGKSDADPLYFSFLGREPPELAAGGTWINPADGPTLASLRGKLVLLQFAFLECPSCALMTPHLERWHNAYGPRGLVVLYVDNGLTDRLESAKTTVAARKIPYPFFHDPEGKTLAAYGVRAFPTAYLIAPDGKVLWEGGPIGIEAALEERIVKALP